MDSCGFVFIIYYSKILAIKNHIQHSCDTPQHVYNDKVKHYAISGHYPLGLAHLNSGSISKKHDMDIFPMYTWMFVLVTINLLYFKFCDNIQNNWCRHCFNGISKCVSNFILVSKRAKRQINVLINRHQAAMKQRSYFHRIKDKYLWNKTIPHRGRKRVIEENYNGKTSIGKIVKSIFGS